MNDIDKIILRMIIATGAEKEAEMLRIAGLSSGAAGAWRRRGKVPDGSIAKVSERTNFSFEWIKTGEGDRHKAQEEQGGEEIYRRIADLVRDHAGEWMSGQEVELTPLEVERELLIRTLPRDKQQSLDNILNAFLIEQKTTQQNNG